MPRTGLEPAHLAAHAPETCASTNSATWAITGNSCSECGAENGTRTRDPNLGKVVLYQLSYFRLFYLLSESISLDCGCKGTTIFRTAKTFCGFFQKKRCFLPTKHIRERLHLIIYKLTQHFFVMSGHNNVVVTDGLIEEIGNLFLI